MYACSVMVVRLGAAFLFLYARGDGKLLRIHQPTRGQLGLVREQWHILVGLRCDSFISRFNSTHKPKHLPRAHAHTHTLTPAHTHTRTHAHTQTERLAHSHTDTGTESLTRTGMMMHPPRGASQASN
eukprot:GHVU01154786.1.p1 GENE.GHVU01154786.1~~GHVU01154786.1.p1  ORF type:complete len:127 (+),score=4.33 GHVU01154786.1:74-454(+)